VDDFIAVHDLFDKLLGLLLIHAPYFSGLGVVCFLEALELLLEVLEFVREILVGLGQTDVDLLVLLLLVSKLSLLVSNCLHDLSSPFLQALASLLVHLLTFPKDFKVEFEFFVVKLEDGLHIFHALLKGLHFLLKLDFLISLIVSVLRSESL